MTRIEHVLAAIDQHVADAGGAHFAEGGLWREGRRMAKGFLATAPDDEPAVIRSGHRLRSSIKNQSRRHRCRSVAGDAAQPVAPPKYRARPCKCRRWPC